MSKYTILNNDYYQLMIPEPLEEFGKRVLKFSTEKYKEYLEFFQVDYYGEKIRVAYFLSKEEFIERIKNIKNEDEELPSEWAGGCFYGGEIQILIDDELYYKFKTLAHETFHLFFQKFIYNKNNEDRRIWLDEAMACNFDGTTAAYIEDGRFKEIILSLRNVDFSKIDINEWNNEDIYMYDLFRVIGRFLIETKSDLLDYLNDFEKIYLDEADIAKRAILYFNRKYGE